MRWYFWWVHRRDVHPAQRHQGLFQWLCHNRLGVGRKQRELHGCLTQEAVDLHVCAALCCAAAAPCYTDGRMSADRPCGTTRSTTTRSQGPTPTCLTVEVSTRSPPNPTAKWRTITSYVTALASCNRLQPYKCPRTAFLQVNQVLLYGSLYHDAASGTCATMRVLRRRTKQAVVAV